MTSLNRVVTRLRRRALREQRGFALLLTLGLMGFFAVSVVALLGLTLNMAGLSTLQAGQATKERAASSAIDAAINEIRDDDSVGATPDVPCSPVLPTSVMVDGISPSVTCMGRATIPAEWGPPAPGAPELTLIGAGLYHGTVSPTLTASGTDALEVTGNATVRGAGAGKVHVSGAYAQGEVTPCAADVDIIADPAECGDPDASDLSGYSDTIGEWTRQDIANPSVVPAVPACSGGVITVPPGSYPRSKSDLLNTRMAECPNATFYFPPGKYWFDVDTGGAHSLNFDRQGSSWILGGAATPAPGADEPVDCDPADELKAVEITLSSQTSIFHGQGRVAICGLVRQTGDPALPWRIEPVAAPVTTPAAVTPRCAPNGDADLSNATEFSVPGSFLTSGGARAQFNIDLSQPERGQCRFLDSAGLRFTFGPQPRRFIDSRDRHARRVDELRQRRIGRNHFHGHQARILVHRILSPSQRRRRCAGVRPDEADERRNLPSESHEPRPAFRGDVGGSIPGRGLRLRQRSLLAVQLTEPLRILERRRPAQLLRRGQQPVAHGGVVLVSR